MFEPYTLWEGTLSSGDNAVLFICPTRREVLAVLHINDRMRRLHPCETPEEAEQQAGAIRDELVGVSQIAS